MIFNKLSKCCTFLLLAACGGAQYGTISADTAALTGSCPSGWYDAATVRLYCAEGTSLETRIFAGTACVSCTSTSTPRAKKCNGPWADPAALLCAPGATLSYNRDGSCARCVTERETTGCRTNADCVRTGCSGQYCSDTDIISTCEWREEYACYGTASCACNNGRCGWEQTQELRNCLNNAGSSDSTILTAAP
jgi:eight-cysteine-cluster-containing protein